MLPTRVNSYSNTFNYDSIGNILKKVQVNTVRYDDGREEDLPGTTYTYNYEYTSGRPHAVTSTGSKLYSYDKNGNMTAWADGNQWRTMSWDEENRLKMTVDNWNKVEYRYDDKGIRIVKKGNTGEVVYANQNYTVRGGEIISKHVFAGNTRLASKLVYKKEGIEEDKGTYYYHGDHLGSSNFVSNKTGGFHEHTEYFPYGETWVEEAVSSLSNLLPFKFTAKEFDPETGLYYFGARYYDPKLSRWVSVDPALIEFIPIPGDKKELPSNGVYKPSNLGMYIFSSNNPVMFIDLNGKWDNRIHDRDDEYGGTYYWVNPLLGDKRADALAKACNRIDYSLRRNPLPYIGNQGYHFNENDIKGGPDTRLFHKTVPHLLEAVRYQKKADSYRNNNGGVIGWFKNIIADYYEGKSTDELAAGLHPLQDILAHTEKFSKYNKTMKYHYHDLSPNLADDPRIQPERVKRTKEATTNYIKAFIKLSKDRK